MGTLATAWHAERHARILKQHPEVRSLMGADAWTGAAIVAVVVAQMAAAVLVRHASWGVVALVAYVFGAFFSHALGVLIHEATHNLVARGNFANKVWGLVANIPLVAPAAVAFRREHMLHHRHLGDADGQDTQAPTRAEAQWVGTSWARKIASFTFGRFFYEGRASSGKTPFDGWLAANFAVQIVFMGALLALAGPRPIVYLTIAALAAFGPHPLGARRLSEHLPVQGPQPTVSYYGVLDSLSFHVGHHVEHHDFPAIAWRRLPKLRALAKENYDNLFWARSWTLLLLEYFFRPSYRVDHYLGMGPFLKDEVPSLVTWHGSDGREPHETLGGGVALGLGGQDFAPVARHEHRVLELRRERSVRGHDGPTVV